MYIQMFVLSHKPTVCTYIIPDYRIYKVPLYIFWDILYSRITNSVYSMYNLLHHKAIPEVLCVQRDQQQQQQKSQQSPHFIGIKVLKGQLNKILIFLFI